MENLRIQKQLLIIELAHIDEFSLKCRNEIKPNLFAEFPFGKVVPVARVAENQHQFSWIEDVKRSSSGSVVVRLFEGGAYSSLRKAERDVAKESNVKSIIDVIVTTKGAYKGPWLLKLLVEIQCKKLGFINKTTYKASGTALRHCNRSFGIQSGQRSLNLRHEIEFQEHAIKYYQQTLFNKLFLWNCVDGCQYGCMWITVEVFKERGWAVPQFYGKILILFINTQIIKRVATNPRMVVKKMFGKSLGAVNDSTSVGSGKVIIENNNSTNVTSISSNKLRTYSNSNGSINNAFDGTNS
uniref:Post-GPI attachment to proteins factor 3 n=1 Tax=Glossina pallidipes TaxID=7398 RepID=A0A1B0A5P5_GLOPL